MAKDISGQSPRQIWERNGSPSDAQCELAFRSLHRLSSRYRERVYFKTSAITGVMCEISNEVSDTDTSFRESGVDGMLQRNVDSGEVDKQVLLERIKRQEHTFVHSSIYRLNTI